MGMYGVILVNTPLNVQTLNTSPPKHTLSTHGYLLCELVTGDGVDRYGNHIERTALVRLPQPENLLQLSVLPW